MSGEPAEWTRWRAARHAELSADDSWLSVINLVWLDGPVVRVGSAIEADVRLPHGAAQAGEFRELEGQWWWLAEKAAPQPLSIDREGVAGAATVITLDRFRLALIERQGRLAVRVRDTDWASKSPFAGIDCYPYDSAWVIDATWEALPEPQMLEVPSVTGELKHRTLTHRVQWLRPDGTAQTLLPIAFEAESAFFVFRDRSSGRETYGAGRFLRASLPPAGAPIRLDFNFAYNPPCAFTPFATCPLPPPENWLSFAVQAGERNYTKA